jgi:hypothetical protein
MKKAATIIIVLILASLGSCAAVTSGSDGMQQIGVSPGAPTDLRLAIAQDGFRLTWNLSPQDPGIVTGYEIIRSDLASGPFTRIVTVDRGVSQYRDSTASPETIYYYKVAAMAGTVLSPYSNTVAGER